VPERLTTKELSPRTWRDFERLFSRPGNGWNSCGCMLSHRGCHLPRGAYPTKATQAAQNLKEQKALVDERRSYGILVYSDSEPIGWCQFGPKSELPFSAGESESDKSKWRITCFVTDKRFRRHGVARVALRAAVEAIRRRGGGLIEAHPLAVDASWPYTGTVRLFAAEGFEEVRGFVVNSTGFPRYDRNRVTAGKKVVVMHLTV
jgi:GNAT superfamily N-acetyltransferase